MTDCNCGCATFGPGPHDPDARHARPRSCEHDEPLPECACDCCPKDEAAVEWDSEGKDC